MKPTTALLTASLVANVALVGLYFSRSSAPTPAVSGQNQALTRTVESAAASRAANLAALQAALASGDAAALEAAGLSPEAARELLLGRAFVRAFERARAARANQPSDDRWWRNSRNSTGSSRESQLQARREISDALVAAFGDDLGLFGGPDSSQQLSFLSPEKRDALRRITQDYDEMMAKFSAGGLQLASDRERLKLLRAERDRDIAALLSPAEREAYEMRTSSTAQMVRARYGDGLENEEDFRKVYALQKALDEKYPLDQAGGRITPELMRQRGEAQRQMQEEMRLALGDEKFAALRRATDPDLRNIDSLVSRLNLPPHTTDLITSTRDSLAAESQRINANTALTPDQRRAQIQALGNRAKADLTRTLGNEAADAYAQRSPWVSMLQGGMAYTTNPPANSPGIALGAGPSVHPVLPADGSGQAGTRRMVTIPGPATNAVTTDTFIGAGGVQVMTFDQGPGGGAAPGQRVIVGPTPTPAPGTTAPATSAPR